MADLIPLQGGPAVPPALDGEVLPPERRASVTLQKNPFSQAHARFEVLEGMTLYAIVTSTGLRPTILKYVRVWIGDEEIPSDVWHLVRPKAGTQIYIKLTPGGGGNMLRNILMLVVVLAAAFFAPMIVGALGFAAGSLGATILTPLISMGITMLGMFLINMLIPPPKGPKISERNFLDALRNRFNPFGPLPRIIGKKRVYPVMAAHPYTESSGKKRYLRAMLLVGFGPLRISDIRIGETPITAYNNIEIEVREGWYDERFGKFRLETKERWEFTNGLQGWNPFNATLTTPNGVLRVNSTGTDPVIERSGLAVNGQQNYIVRAKIRRISGSTWQGDCYYTTTAAGRGFYTESYKKTIANPFVRNNEWIICEWDMNALTNGGNEWRDSTITGIRLDLSEDAATTYEIDWIEVGYPCGKDAPRKLYTRSISQLDIGSKLTQGVENIRTTETDAIGFAVDVQFPGGLGENDKNDPGDIDGESVTIDVKYRRLGTTEWQSPRWSSNVAADGTQNNGELYYYAKDRMEAVVGGWANFPEKGQYEVRMIRTTANFDTGRRFGDTYWQSLKSIKDTPSINEDIVGGLAIISIRAKATDQFQSFPDQINCIAESYLPVPNSAGGWTYDVTRNPAWSFTDILRHRGLDKLLDDSRINLTAIREWAAACDATAPNSTKPYWQVDAQLEEGSLFDNCRDIAAHARASFIVDNGLYSVVRDIQQTVPVQLITPKNSWGYNGMKQFIDLPHALRINFTNEAKNYRPDERIVYDDGYSRENATRYETLDFAYCSDPDQAYREARYHMAVGKLRPEQHRVTMDIENLRCTLGDYVMLSHDVLSIGSGTGRVTARAGTTTITAITLDEAIPLDTAKAYGVRYRRGNTGTIYTAQLAAITATAEYTTFTFSAGIPAATAPLVGDLVLVGVFGVESAPMLVKRIEPGPDMTATLTLVDAQPGVWTADQAEIPPFNSYITEEVIIPQRRPAPPNFRLVSDEQALVRQSDGSLPDQIMVIMTTPAASTLAVTGFEMQWRSSPGDLEGEWSSTVSTEVGSNTLWIGGVRAGRPYDVRVRSVSEFGLASEWVTILNHVVAGKTNPPAAVSGLTATAGIEGVQLTWTPNTELDLKGYIVKQGTGWETATLVSEVLAGTSIFVKCDTSVPQTFLVRAVDLVGNTSASNASVTSGTIVPGSVSGLEGYLQVDVVFLKWKPVSMVGVRYEVRQGTDWKTARLINTVSNEEIRTRLPSSSTVDRVFWVDAVSPMGVYSGNPQSVTLTVLAVPNVNVVVERDLVALGFPGRTQDLQISGATLLSVLDASGQQYPRADCYYPLDLGAEYAARCWVDMNALSVQGAGLTWDGATQSWDQYANQTWLGSISANRAGDVTPRISLQGAFDPALIEGWRLSGSANGTKLGTVPTVNTRVTYLAARFDTGATFERRSQLAYNFSVPSQFSLAVDVRPRNSVNDTLLFRLNGTGIILWCCMNALVDDGIYVFDHLGNVNWARIPIETGDVITIVLTQSSSERALYVSSRRYEPISSDIKPFAAAGAYTSIAFYEG